MLYYKLLYSQAITGINSVIFYSSTIFGLAGFSEAIIGTSCVSAINVGMTLVISYLIDTTGRKFLLLFGTYLMYVQYRFLLYLSSLVFDYLIMTMCWCCCYCTIGWRLFWCCPSCWSRPLQRPPRASSQCWQCSPSSLALLLVWAQVTILHCTTLLHYSAALYAL